MNHIQIQFEVRHVTGQEFDFMEYFKELPLVLSFLAGFYISHKWSNSYTEKINQLNKDIEILNNKLDEMNKELKNVSKTVYNFEGQLKGIITTKDFKGGVI